MISVFLSHSNDDKPEVRKLSDDLRNNGFSVWLDEINIIPGRRFLDEIEEGLSKSEFICVWLTPSSAKSRWVEAELKEVLAQEISSGKSSIVPLYAKPCKIPYWLKSRNYIDFTEDYSAGLSKLVKTLRHTKNEPRNSSYITEKTSEFLDNLSGAQIDFPLHHPIKIIETLKKLPRSGKILRLHKFRPEVRIRSVYEHILSVSHSADCFFNTAEHNLKRGDAIEVARLIAFHELNEVILGDIPAYTPLTGPKRERASITAERRLATVDPETREAVTNNFISMFLGERDRLALESVNSHRRNDDDIYKFFHLLDKIDPIVGIWRLLHDNRRLLDGKTKYFINLTRDFFQNPYVKNNTISRSKDGRFASLVDALQDSHLASEYAVDANFFASTAHDFGFDSDLMRHLIEGFRYSLVE